jgi:hypothetical protein
MGLDMKDSLWRKRQEPEALKRITRDDTEHDKEYYLALEVDALLSKQKQGEPVIDKSAAIRIATALGWTQPQPEQGEPVAWSDEQLKMLNFLYGAGEFDGVWFGEKHLIERGAFWWRKHLRRLFTTPPQRTWVGIDGDECSEFSSMLDWKSDAEVFAAIDAKLKEKNAHD